MNDPVAVEYWNTSDDARFVLEWTLGNTCNYECSYCPSRLHDGSEAWIDKDTIVGFCAKAIAHYSDKRVTCLFTGGEPSLYRDMLWVLRELNGYPCDLAIISNGSRTLRWWNTAAEYLDMVILSYHPEFADFNHFVEVIELLTKNSVAVQVNMLFRDDWAADILSKAARLAREYPSIAVITKPLVDNWERLAPVADTSRGEIGKRRGQSRAGDGFCLKSELRVVREDGTEECWEPEELLAAGMTNWRNWTCQIGMENLLVRFDKIYRGNCKIGGCIGDVRDAAIQFPTASIVCSKPSCICLGDIKVRKSRLALATGNRLVG